MKEGKVFTLDEISKGRGPDKTPRKKKKTMSMEEWYRREAWKPQPSDIIDRRRKKHRVDGSKKMDYAKSKIFTLDELKKANGKELKLTKDEAREWINIRIRNSAKSKIRYPENKEACLTLGEVATTVYENLVDDWTYNNKVLEASRAVKLDPAYVLEVISPLFDDEGKPRALPKVNGTLGDAKCEAAPTYAASVVSLNEAYDDLQKGRGKDKSPRKKRLASIKSIIGTVVHHKKHGYGKVVGVKQDDAGLHMTVQHQNKTVTHKPGTLTISDSKAKW